MGHLNLCENYIISLVRYAKMLQCWRATDKNRISFFSLCHFM